MQNISELVYVYLNIKNLNGKITLKDEQLNLNNLAANLLGGSALVNRYYNTKQTYHRQFIPYYQKILQK